MSLAKDEPLVADDDPLNEDDVDAPEQIPIRVEPLTQQSASPTDIDKGLRLLQLCREGDLQAVQWHVQQGAPAGFITKTKWTAIAAAAYGGRSDIVVYLLDLEADGMYKTTRRRNLPPSSVSVPSVAHSDPANAGDSSAVAGSPSIMVNGSLGSSPLLGNGVNTPLHWACYQGHMDVVSILVHAGYSIEDVDSVGNRCLHLACSGGHHEVVEFLLANSASVDQKNQYGNRALDLATESACRRLLLKFQAQTVCEWCKEAFNRIRRPSLCQHCHNIYCDAKPCSSTEEVGSTKRLMRYCQECATEMGKTEQDLRNVLDSKLELVSQTLALITSSGSSSNNNNNQVELASSDRPGSGRADDPSPNNEDSAASLESIAASNDAAFDAEAATTEQVISLDSAGSATDPSLSASSAAIETANSESDVPLTSKPNVPLSQEDIVRVLTLTRTDAEALYTAVEAAQEKAVDSDLIQKAKRTYHQLVAHVMLQEEIKALMLVRPIGIRSLIEPLKTALKQAQRENVSGPMLQLAIQVVQSAEAECTLFGCHALCVKIELGTKKHRRDIARLEASIIEVESCGGNDKLLESAVALRNRLNTEIALEACLQTFSEAHATSVTETGVEIVTTQYAFEDGTVVPSLLAALELRSQRLTAAVVRSSSTALSLVCHLNERFVLCRSQRP